MNLVSLFGWPASSSFSPCMFNAAFEELDLDFKYVTLDVPPGRFNQVSGIFAAQNVIGANVTIPHKEEALKFVDMTTDRAEVAGAVNVIYRENGTVKGDNTDGFAVVRSLELKGCDLVGGKAVLFGAGGSARGVAAALVMAGVKELYIFNRTVEKAQKLAYDMSSIKRETGVPSVTTEVHGINGLGLEGQEPIDDVVLERVSEIMAGACVVVNATTLTRGIDGRRLLPDEALKKCTEIGNKPIFCDMVYNPLMTSHLKQARENGFEIVTGLEILFRQALPAFKLWTGHDVPWRSMADALIKASGFTQEEIFGCAKLGV